MFTPTANPPTFVTPEEHAQITSSTPESFSDIPPALRFHDTEVDIEVDPKLDFLDEKAKGTLWVTEKAFVFIPTGSANGSEAPLPTGFSLEYPSITLHAISPASDGAPANLYCQVEDSSAAAPAHTEAEEENEVEDDEDVTPMRELKVFVKTAEQLNQLFNALSLCASLHPSQMSPGDELSGQRGFFGGNPDDEDRELPFPITGLPNGADGAFQDAAEPEANGDDSVDGGRTRSDYQSGTERFRPY